MQPLPGPRGKQLARNNQVDTARSYWEEHADHALQQQPEPKTSGEDRGPNARMGLLFLETPQKSPHRQRDTERQHHIGNEDPREEKQPDARGHAKSGVETGP